MATDGDYLPDRKILKYVLTDQALKYIEDNKNPARSSEFLKAVNHTDIFHHPIYSHKFRRTYFKQMEKEELKRQVEILRIHRDLQRIFVSDAVKDMIDYIDQNIAEDGLVVAPDKKKNPWADNRKCTIL